MSQVVLSEDHGAVRLLTLNRPERLNALNNELADAMMAELARAAADRGVGAVVLTGAGRAFSAGADLAVFKEISRSKDPALAERFADLGFPRAFINFPKPLIAAINGPGVGWGATVPLMCDLRLMSAKAMISYGFVKVGVTPEFGSAHLLPRIVGLGKALELVLTGREVAAEEALAMGLVNRVCAPENLLAEALELAATIAALPRSAVSMAKRVVRQCSQIPLDQTLDYEIVVFRQAMAGEEHAAAVAAMLAAIAAK